MHRSAYWTGIVHISFLENDHHKHIQQLGVLDKRLRGINQRVGVVSHMSCFHFLQNSFDNHSVTWNVLPKYLIRLHGFLNEVSPPLHDLEKCDWALLKSRLPLFAKLYFPKHSLGISCFRGRRNMPEKVEIPIEESDNSKLVQRLTLIVIQFPV